MTLLGICLDVYTCEVKSMSNRSEAANKAWETRRANERAAMLSERAQKAVATRKKNQLAAKRRESALKAVATRRRNQG